ncbi:MAG: hypothetical protein ACFBWO_11370 [Paracoccaceae bacterium]
MAEALAAIGAMHPNGPLADKPRSLTGCAVLDLDGNLLTFFEETRR